MVQIYTNLFFISIHPNKEKKCQHLSQSVYLTVNLKYDLIAKFKTTYRSELSETEICIAFTKMSKQLTKKYTLSAPNFNKNVQKVAIISQNYP